MTARLGRIQIGHRVGWTDLAGNHNVGRVIDFTYCRETHVPACTIDVLPYTSQRKRVIVALHNLTSEQR